MTVPATVIHYRRTPTASPNWRMLTRGAACRRRSESNLMIAKYRDRLAVALIAVILTMPAGHGAWSQTARTIKIVVPYPPGSGPDILSRLMGEQIGRAQGPSVLVENRPGGGTVIGTEAVARAAPDGNTLLITSVVFVINPHLRKLNYDPLTSFEPICNLVQSPQLLVVNSASPHRTFADLTNAARAKPGELTLASTGPAS